MHTVIMVLDGVLEEGWFMCCVQVDGDGGHAEVLSRGAAPVFLRQQRTVHHLLLLLPTSCRRSHKRLLKHIAQGINYRTEWAIKRWSMSILRGSLTKYQQFLVSFILNLLNNEPVTLSQVCKNVLFTLRAVGKFSVGLAGPFLNKTVNK